METLTLGNTAVVEVFKVREHVPDHPSADKDGYIERDNRVDRSDLGNKITTFNFPDEFAPDRDLEAIQGDARHAARIRALPDDQKPFYLHAEAVEDAWWKGHSNDPPEWVESDVEPLAKLVASRFTLGDHQCAIGRPKGWEED